MKKVFLSLGSNIGDKRAYLDDAVKILSDHEAVCNVKKSSYYETAPVGYLDQDVFMNICVSLETDLSPYALLALCQEIEETLKRVRIVRWGPRTIDVDILLYDDMISTDEKLTLPHPRMLERGFVLVPLKELEPSLVIQGKGIDAYLAIVDQTGIVRKNDR